MIPVRPNTKALFTVVAILSALSIAIVIAVTRETVLYALLRVGSVLSLVILPLWLYVDKIGWHQRFFRFWGWLCQTPDIRGRWEGSLDRGDERGPHKFVLEVRQTLTTIECDTYSSRGSSSSFVAVIVSDELVKKFKLIYTWLAKAGPLKKGDKPDRHLSYFYGTSILDLIEGTPRIMKGEYYTGRSPYQTKGTITLTWQGLTLLSRFEEGQGKQP